MNSPNSHNAISLPGSDSGPSHFGLPGGPILDRSGQEVARASLSARQAKEMGLLTSGTFGPHGFTLSASAALSESLANKLRQRTDCAGSILYRLTWKVRVTPAGRSIYALRASGHHISVSDLALLRGWNTPRATDGSNGGPSQAGGALSADAALTGWPTPHENSGTGPGTEGREGGMNIQTVAALTGWPTPNTMTGGQTSRGGDRKGEPLMHGAAQLAAWPTPTTRDHKDGSSDGTVPINALLGRAAWLAQPARLTHLGQMQIGYGAGMKSGGQLNPEHSRWLMGIPPVWAFCAPMGTRSSRKSLRRSSKPPNQ